MIWRTQRCRRIFGRGKKIILWPLGLLVALVVALWAYDEELEPYDDLAPLETVDQDPARNGYFFLKARWENLPELKLEDERRLADMSSGKAAWDPALVAELRKGREGLIEDVKEALKRPEFKAPAHWSLEDMEPLNVSSMGKPLRSLSMEFLSAVQSGDVEKSMEIWEQTHAMDSRFIHGSQTFIGMLVGGSLHATTLTNVNALLVAGQLNDGQLQRLDAALQTDLQAPAVWRRAMSSTAAFNRSVVEAMADGGAEELLREAPQYSRLLLKRNKTINRINEKHRILSKLAFLPFPDIQSAKVAGFFGRDGGVSKWTRYVDLNRTGTLLFAQDLGAYPFIMSDARTRLLFQPRALRVKIAILRWREAHPGQWPATLRELVPDFLTEVPEDPFNGRDLEWDPVKRIIFCVGSDWLANDPQFPDPFAWFASDHKSPGLRMERPPAPPLAAPSSKPKS